jgi:hypothetical protein
MESYRPSIRTSKSIIPNARLKVKEVSRKMTHLGIDPTITPSPFLVIFPLVHCNRTALPNATEEVPAAQKPVLHRPQPA